jgi:hypothetical protein
MQQERGYAVPLTYGRLGESTGARAIDISAAIRRLISARVLAVQPGGDGRASMYLPALPRDTAERLTEAARLSAAVEDNAAPPW